MAESLVPGEAPVSLNEARSWLRLGATVDDAMVAGLVRAATNICEAFIGQWLVIRAAEEVLPLKNGAVQPGARPVVGIDGVTLLFPDGEETALGGGDYRAAISGDGTAWVTVDDPGGAVRVRIAYRAGIAEGMNGIPEAIRQGIVRMTQHLHEARDGAGAGPPGGDRGALAAVAAFDAGRRAMTGAEGAVRARTLDLLARDDALAAMVHGIFDGTPPRASGPYVTVGAVEGVDWGTKDRPGREVRLTLTLVGVGRGADDRAAARVEAVVAALRGAAGVWSVVGARTIRTRFTFARDGGWRHEILVRCRCLAV